MNKYYVANANDTVFDAVISKIKSIFPEAKSKKPLTDVDGSRIQSFDVNGKAISIIISYEDDEIWVHSEIDLSHIDFLKIKESA